MSTPIQINTPLIQVTGGQTYQLNIETTAGQVKCADGISAEVRLQTLERAIAGQTTLSIVQNIAERDALEGQIAGNQAWVLDATDDPTVESGGAKYLYMLDSNWLKVAEAESMDIICDWDHILSKPESTPAQIDLAVAKQHTHDNIETIAQISDDGTSKLLYKGKAISDGLVWVCRVTSLEAIPANLADGGLVFVVGGEEEEGE